MGTLAPPAPAPPPPSSYAYMDLFFAAAERIEKTSNPISYLCQSLLTGVTVVVSLQGTNPVTEPGNNGTSTNLMVCASVSSSPGDIERDTVVSVSSTEGTAGT